MKINNYNRLFVLLALSAVATLLGVKGRGNGEGGGTLADPTIQFAGGGGVKDIDDALTANDTRQREKFLALDDVEDDDEGDVPSGGNRSHKHQDGTNYRGIRTSEGGGGSGNKTIKNGTTEDVSVNNGKNHSLVYL